MTSPLVTTGMVLVGGSNMAIAVIDPVWAAPANTLLLVLLAILGRSLSRTATDTHHAATNAASASASAAEAAAAAARITKELGGIARSVDTSKVVEPPS